MGRIKRLVDDIKDANGAGDLVKAVTTVFGIEACSECEERRKQLNDMFPFLNQVKVELTEEEMILVRGWYESKSINDRQRFVQIYNKTFKTALKVCNCAQLYADLLVKLMKQVEKQEIK